MLLCDIYRSRWRTVDHVLPRDTSKSSSGVVGESEVSTTNVRLRTVTEDTSAERNVVIEDLKEPMKGYNIFYNPGFKQSSDV